MLSSIPLIAPRDVRPNPSPPHIYKTFTNLHRRTRYGTRRRPRSPPPPQPTPPHSRPRRPRSPPAKTFTRPRSHAPTPSNPYASVSHPSPPSPSSPSMNNHYISAKLISSVLAPPGSVRLGLQKRFKVSWMRRQNGKKQSGRR